MAKLHEENSQKIRETSEQKEKMLVSWETYISVSTPFTLTLVTYKMKLYLQKQDQKVTELHRKIQELELLMKRQNEKFTYVLASTVIQNMIFGKYFISLYLKINMPILWIN